MQRFERNFFLLVLLLVSVALAWVVLPFSGAILWAVIATIMFAPVNARILATMPDHRNSAALLTLAIIIALVVLPALIVGTLLVQEAAGLYQKLSAGQIDFVQLFENVHSGLPGWAIQWLDRMGLEEFSDLRDRMATGLANSAQLLAGHALSIGQSTFEFFVAMGVSLYLIFFLLRDGRKLVAQIDRTIPLPAPTRHQLAEKFVAVIRATINGSMVVAIVQGGLGGFIFWVLGIPAALLWAVVMAFFSLLPAIGTGIIWLPVALYLFVTGAVGKGLILVAFGVLVIGTVDNVLRPILVGRDTRIPDYVILVTTLGGITIFGFNGIIIGPAIAALFLAIWDIFAQMRAGQLPPAD